MDLSNRIRRSAAYPRLVKVPPKQGPLGSVGALGKKCFGRGQPSTLG